MISLTYQALKEKLSLCVEARCETKGQAAQDLLNKIDMPKLVKACEDVRSHPQLIRVLANAIRHAEAA